MTQEVKKSKTIDTQKSPFPQPPHPRPNNKDLPVRIYGKKESLLVLWPFMYTSH